MTHRKGFARERTIGGNCGEKIAFFHTVKYKAYGVFLLAKLTGGIGAVDIIDFGAGKFFEVFI